MRFLVVIASMTLFLVQPALLLAQTEQQLIDLSIETIPLSPTPHGTVTLRAASYSIDLNQANISWQYGGKQVAVGIGKTTVQVIAPASGSSAVATVSVSGVGIAPVSSSIILQPGSVDLLWEAIDSYTPPFYKGKALLPRNGVFEVTALPSAQLSRTATYTWSKNDSTLPSSSGVGKSSIVLYNDTLNAAEKIAVEISSGATQGGGSVVITPRLPSIIGYPKVEGYVEYGFGFNDSVGFRGPGAVLRFEPYYFSVPHSIANDLTFDIRLGEQSVYNDPINEVRLARPTGSGKIDLTIGIATATYSLQNARRVFEILFDE